MSCLTQACRQAKVSCHKYQSGAVIGQSKATHLRPQPRWARIVHCVASLIFLHLLVGNETFAADFVVTNASDSGPGTLRQAILDANASLGPDTISFNNSNGAFTIVVA